ncbi:MAG: hypothetical protein E4H18_04185 [Hyphomicrobiales bacterium]|nr:MAG: hypothetical protein E4H18_04185 [Hyphomicrobiales bacterium]
MVEKRLSVEAERPAPTDEELDATPPLPLVVWAARCSAYFLALGGIMLVSYLFYGFDTDPQSSPPGFRLNPLQAGVDFIWGLVGTAIGFFRPRFATAFVLAFAAFFTLVAGLGTFAGSALGMELGTSAKLFYWVVVAGAWAVGVRALLGIGRAG